MEKVYEENVCGRNEIVTCLSMMLHQILKLKVHQEICLYHHQCCI